ncbi:MAG: DUF2497 domain-containing protein [Hyphomicrobiaceae bacterium]|nr:DUF2497 domain-containing protein [Hyphomicrobiaceae bacterium]
MANSGAAAEPSMEEILASIRRIISDDGPDDAAEASVEEEAPEPEVEAQDGMSEEDLDALFANADGSPEPNFDEPEMEAEEDVLELDAALMVEEEPAEEAPAVDPFDALEDEPHFDPDSIDASELDDLVDADQDLDFADPSMMAAPEPAYEEPEPEPEPIVRAVARQVAEEAPRLLSPAADQAASAAFANLASTILSNNARTLEDLVQEMLRPMLKSWLDENLPVLVEKLVRQEIERVARGGRR